MAFKHNADLGSMPTPSLFIEAHPLKSTTGSQNYRSIPCGTMHGRGFDCDRNRIGVKSGRSDSVNLPVSFFLLLSDLFNV